jgi:hypothetical protein
VGFDEDGEELGGTRERSVSVVSPNGSRMTITRIDGDSLNNPVVTDFMENGEYSSNSKYYQDFFKTYHNLERAYTTYINGYNDNVQNAMNEWLSIHDVADYGSPETTESVRRAYKKYNEAYDKEFKRVLKDKARNDSEFNKALETAVHDFKELGFEFSMEWVNT